MDIFEELEHYKKLAGSYKEKYEKTGNKLFLEYYERALNKVRIINEIIERNKKENKPQRKNMNKEQEDYKDYVYLRIPKSEYNKIVSGDKRVTKEDIKAWRFDYELKQSNKSAYAKRANQIRTARIIQKIYKILENYYLGLFRNEEKELTAYRLSKLAKINYRTAKRFFEEHNLKEWLQKFEKDPQNSLKEFKVKELSEYFVY